MTALFFHVIERNVFAYRRLWGIFLTGFAEPLLYLASIGIGVGALVGTVKGPGGQMVPYDQFVAPGLLAAAAMNGSVFDTTFNFFFKYKYARTFDAMLATPLGPTDVALGEMGWALIRGTIYAAAFLLFMAILGLTSSPWAVFCLPGAMLIGFAFAGARDGRHDVHAVVRRLRLREHGAAAAVPLLGHVLPAVAVPHRVAVGRAVHPALPGRRARTVAGVRRPELGHRRARRLPRRGGHDRGLGREPPPRPSAPAVTRAMLGP